MRDPETVAGFNRQRRSLLAVSLVLLGIQGLNPQLGSLAIFGSTITLEAPLNIATPLWIAWIYFLVRYYQYLRDLGDKGIHSTYRDRLINLANAVAKHSAYRHLPLDTEGLSSRRTIRIDAKDINIVVSQPPPWEYEITGAAHIDERPPGTKGRMQMLEKQRFRLPPSSLIVPRVRAVWWVIAHTRLMTEYALPLIVAALPAIRAGWHRLSAALVAV